MGGRVVRTGLATVPTNVFTTVLTLPAGLLAEVSGYVAVPSISGPTIPAALPYVARLIVGAATVHLYPDRASDIAWVPIFCDTNYASVIVQVLHNSATDTDFRAVVSGTLAS